MKEMTTSKLYVYVLWTNNVYVNTEIVLCIKYVLLLLTSLIYD